MKKVPDTNYNGVDSPSRAILAFIFRFDIIKLS